MLRIFSVCLLGNIKLEVEWTPRSANDRANFLSTIFDYTHIRSSGLPVGRMPLWVDGFRKVGINLQLRHIGLHRVELHVQEYRRKTK